MAFWDIGDVAVGTTRIPAPDPLYSPNEADAEVQKIYMKHVCCGVMLNDADRDEIVAANKSFALRNSRQIQSLCHSSGVPKGPMSQDFLTEWDCFLSTSGTALGFLHLCLCEGETVTHMTISFARHLSYLTHALIRERIARSTSRCGYRL